MSKEPKRERCSWFTCRNGCTHNRPDLQIIPEEKKGEECCGLCGSTKTCKQTPNCRHHLDDFSTPTPHQPEDWKLKFRRDFVCDVSPEEHAFVGMYNEDDNKFEFWNAYKIESFIQNLIQQVREEELKRVEKIIEGMQEELDESLYNWDGYPSSGQQAKEVIEIIINNLHSK